MWIIWVCAHYAAFAWIIAVLLDRPAPKLSSPLVTSFAYAFLSIGAVAMLLVALRPLWSRSRGRHAAAPLVLDFRRYGWRTLVGFFVVVFLCAFSTSVKSAMSVVADFTWDQSLADLDAALHMGYDAWRLYVPLVEQMSLATLQTLYMPLWVIQAAALPVGILLLERDSFERRRYFICFFVVWIVLGNIAAIAFLSGGPIYFAELTGDSRFQPLLEWLQGHAADIQLTNLVHETLWRAHVADDPHLGGGISAFPSVHVAMATLTALYLGSRLGLFGWAFGIPFLVLIQLGSVIFAWHYAIDGYFSIIVVWLAWRLASRGRRIINVENSVAQTSDAAGSAAFGGLRR